MTDIIPYFTGDDSSFESGKSGRDADKSRYPRIKANANYLQRIAGLTFLVVCLFMNVFFYLLKSVFCGQLPFLHLLTGKRIDTGEEGPCKGDAEGRGR
jgi:hypothetical protein